ncbi:hypothetical protein ABK040_013356 [Willaertia magna]
MNPLFFATKEERPPSNNLFVAMNNENNSNGNGSCRAATQVNPFQSSIPSLFAVSNPSTSNPSLFCATNPIQTLPPCHHTNPNTYSPTTDKPFQSSTILPQHQCLIPKAPTKFFSVFQSSTHSTTTIRPNNNRLFSMITPNTRNFNSNSSINPNNVPINNLLIPNEFDSNSILQHIPIGNSSNHNTFDNIGTLSDDMLTDEGASNSGSPVYWKEDDSLNLSKKRTIDNISCKRRINSPESSGDINLSKNGYFSSISSSDDEMFLCPLSNVNKPKQIRKKRKQLTNNLSNSEFLYQELQYLPTDCILHILQFLSFSGKGDWFLQIKNMYGRFINGEILPLFKHVTLLQICKLELNNNHVFDCNIKSITIDRRTNERLDCDTDYFKDKYSLENITYCNHTAVNYEVSNETLNYNPSTEESMDFSYELIEDENSHVIGLKRKNREGTFLKNMFKSCQYLKKLKIIDISGTIPMKISMSSPAFTPVLRKLRLNHCLITTNTLMSISQMRQLESLHLINCSSVNTEDFDLLLQLQYLKSLKLEVFELSDNFYRGLYNYIFLEKLNLNLLNQINNFKDKLPIEKLKRLKSLTIVNHFKIDLLSIMRNCNLQFLHLGFDVCFNHIFPNEKLRTCVLRNVFISPDRSKVLINNNVLKVLKLYGTSFKAAKRTIEAINEERKVLGKFPIEIKEIN